MQAICDSMERFLDVEIAFPGATSDFFAFHNSQIEKKHKVDEFLSLGLALFLALFADNAFTNSPYMVTHFRMSVLVLRMHFIFSIHRE